MKNNDKIIYFPYIHVILMTLTGLMFALFLIKPFREFTSNDYGPKISVASPKKIAEFSKEHRIVNTHLSIYEAPEFNFENGGTISFNGYIIFTYDPKIISFDLIKKFDIQKGDLRKLDPVIINHKNGLQSAHFSIKTTFTMFMDFTDYPLDDHLISFAIINAYAKPNELLYIVEKNDFSIEQNYAMSRWKDIGHKTESGLIEKKFNDGVIKYPGIMFEISYSHSAMRKTSIILLPLFLIFFLTTFGLSLNPQRFHSTIITVSVTGLSALMAYRFVIESISPNVGYFMLSDYLFFLFFCAVFINFMLSMFVETIPRGMLKKGILVMYSLVIGICGYLLLFWL